MVLIMPITTPVDELDRCAAPGLVAGNVGENAGTAYNRDQAFPERKACFKPPTIVQTIGGFCMIFRQFGILLMISGFLTGQLLGALVAKSDFQTLASSAAGTNIQEIAAIWSRCLGWMVIGDAVALVGLVIYFYGVLTSRSGRTTVVTGHPV
jgi:hypothetical protein